MPKAIRTLDRQGLTIGFATLGGADETPVRRVHDGDTINVAMRGDLGIRFLGIDTPEVSFSLPGEGGFPAIDGEAWGRFLTDPLSERWGAFEIPEGLRRWLEARVGDDAAANHHRHAEAARVALVEEIERDMRAMGQDAETFGFFLSFAFEIMDVYGRLLCYVNRDQPDRNVPGPRPLTYNERLVEQGRAVPYFIWPNVNPWKKADSVLAAAVAPEEFRRAAAEDRVLGRTREFMEAARVEHRGIYDAMDPLRLEAFELRYLSRRELPSRWLIDLRADDNVLLRPQNYYRVPHPEDRLWIPPEYVPLFVERGWRREEA